MNEIIKKRNLQKIGIPKKYVPPTDSFLQWVYKQAIAIIGNLPLWENLSGAIKLVMEQRGYKEIEDRFPKSVGLIVRDFIETLVTKISEGNNKGNDNSKIPIV